MKGFGFVLSTVTEKQRFGRCSSSKFLCPDRVGTSIVARCAIHSYFGLGVPSRVPTSSTLSLSRKVSAGQIIGGEYKHSSRHTLKSMLCGTCKLSARRPAPGTE